VAQVVCFKPLRERGLSAFRHPQSPLENAQQQPSARQYGLLSPPPWAVTFPRLRGWPSPLAMGREALQTGRLRYLTGRFLAQECDGLERYLAKLDATPMDITSWLSPAFALEAHRAGAQPYRHCRKGDYRWVDGITHTTMCCHYCRNSRTCQICVGSLGKAGWRALCSRSRGHSKCQGDSDHGHQMSGGQRVC